MFVDDDGIHDENIFYLLPIIRCSLILINKICSNMHVVDAIAYVLVILMFIIGLVDLST